MTTDSDLTVDQVSGVVDAWAQARASVTGSNPAEGWLTASMYGGFPGGGLSGTDNCGYGCAEASARGQMSPGQTIMSSGVSFASYFWLDELDVVRREAVDGSWVRYVTWNPQPVITQVIPAEWQAGATTAAVVCGRNFGTSDTLTASTQNGVSVVLSDVQAGNTGQDCGGLSAISFNATVGALPSGQASANVELTLGVTAWGNSWLPQTPPRTTGIARVVGCTGPRITAVKVNGQNSNTIISGTSGTIKVEGNCLLDNTSLSVGGNGVAISSILSSTDSAVNAIFAANTSTAGGSHPLQLVTLRGSTQSSVFVTKVEVLRSTFAANPLQNFVIRKDNWILGLQDEHQPVWSAGNRPDDNDAAGYVKESVPNGNVTFKLSPMPPNPIPGLRIEGNVPGLGTFIADNVSFQQGPAGSTESAPVAFTSDTALPSATKFYNPLSIEWKVSADGRTCSTTQACTITGTTAGRLYVTLKNPAYAEVALTYVHLATAIDGATDLTKAVENTWAQFAGPANVTDWRGLPLTYYRSDVPSNSCALSALKLLTNDSGSGQCGSFALLFEAALAMNGIPVQVPGTTPLGTPLARWSTVTTIDDTWMLIKNWKFPRGPSNSTSSPFPYLFTPSFPDFMVPEPASYGDLDNDEGIAGQGTLKPGEKVFIRHFIVKLDPQLLKDSSGPPYFDPSYGTRYKDAADFQSQAIEGYVRVPISPAPPYFPVPPPYGVKRIISSDPTNIPPTNIRLQP